MQFAHSSQQLSGQAGTALAQGVKRQGGSGGACRVYWRGESRVAGSNRCTLDD